MTADPHRARPAGRGGQASGLAVTSGHAGEGPDAAAEAVAWLYKAHVLSLTRLAHVILGDKAAAEDVVHDAFCGLYLRWHHLSDSSKALSYVRSSVLNGCRSVMRRRTPTAADSEPPPTASAESEVMAWAEQQEIMQAIRQLPPRQREVLVLRYYLDLPDADIASVMGIGASSVRSAARRAGQSLARIMGGGHDHTG
jgi:RNA polymerase sigma-70 factor (sigma-E family)